MKFQVNRDALSEAVSFAVRLLTQKQTMQILSGVLIEASDNALQLSVFDYEVSARAGIVAKVDEPGKVLVNGRLLSEIGRDGHDRGRSSGRAVPTARPCAGRRRRPPPPARC